MGNASKRNGFYTRSFTTFLVALSFLMLFISGIVVYATPRGRTANWTGWTFAGLGKHDWGGIHTMSALLFVLIAGLHIFFNWKVLLNYIRSRRSTGFRLKRELAAAALVCSVVFVGTLYDLPPFGSVLAANEAIKDYWEGASSRPPVAHAEDLTLSEFAGQIGVPVEDLAARLRERGVPEVGHGTRVGDVADAAGVTPDVVFQWVSGDAGHEARAVGSTHTGGQGLGRMTIGDFCKAKGIDQERLLEILSERGVVSSHGMTMRQIASRLNVSPHQVASLVLPESAQPR